MQLPSPLTINQLITDCASSNPSTIALRASGMDGFSFQSLPGCSTFIRQLLNDKSITYQSRVGVFMVQGWMMSLTTLGVMANCTCVPLNTQTTRQELALQLQELALSAVLVDESADDELLAEFEAHGVKLIQLQTQQLIRAMDADYAPVETDWQMAGEEDIALVLQTSGSTARPKKIALTHRQLLLSAGNLCRSLALTDQDSCLNIMPPFHVGAIVDLLLAPMLARSSVIITDDSSPGGFWNACETAKPTWFQAVPTMLQAMMGSLSPDRLSACNSLRLIRSVSSKLPDTLATEVSAGFGVPVIEIYGMSEAAGLITSPPLDAVKTGSVGKAVGVELSIRDSQGQVVQPGQTGEIFIRGETVIDAYVGDSAANDAEFANGWLHTGDLGYLDSDDYLYLSGRRKEVINRGGEKISPLEIDNLLHDFPGLREAAAFAKPHRTLGEDVALAVVIDDPAVFSERSLHKYLAKILPAHKLPHRIYVLDQLPRNPGGKLKRHEIYATALESLKQAEDNRHLPATEREKELARYWQQALNVADIHLEDNFFDRGGDSLKAVTLMTTLEQRFDVSLPPAMLIDAPRLMDFCRALYAVVDAGQPAVVEPIVDQTLPAELESLLSKLIDTWEGQRTAADSLLVGLNTQGKRQPLFWCAHGYEQVGELASLLGDDQPVYGMRSLNSIVRRNKRNYEQLGRRYVKDILTVQPQGPYMLGGFCGGGMVAFAMANQLRELGHEVNLLILYDVLPSTQYDGRLLLFYSANESVSPYGIFNAPELGISKMFSGDLSIYHYDWGHNDKDFLDHLGSFAADVQYEISCLKNHQVSSKTVKSPLTAPLQDKYFARKVWARVPRMVKASDSIEVPVTIQNCSAEDWQPTEQSGVTLSSRWVGTSNIVRKQRAGYVSFDAGVPAADKQVFSLRIRTPDKPGLRSLEIDLLEEGVDWLGTSSKVAFRQWVWVKAS